MDAVLILVDDADDLQQNQMRVELDVNPFNAVDSKGIEAWGFCRSGSRVNLVEDTLSDESGNHSGKGSFQVHGSNKFRLCKSVPVATCGQRQVGGSCIELDGMVSLAVPKVPEVFLYFLRRCVCCF
jgi:hypothetical protein